MMSELSGVSAFPSHGSMGEVVQEGMTLRDYFAAMAMQGYCSCSDLSEWTSTRGLNPSDVRDAYAKSAYAQADAMIKARSAK